jgi:hypothetical protein
MKKFLSLVSKFFKWLFCSANKHNNVASSDGCNAVIARLRPINNNRKSTSHRIHQKVVSGENEKILKHRKNKKLNNY